MNTGLAHARPAPRRGWVAGSRHGSATPREEQQRPATDRNARAHQAGLREMSTVAAANVWGRLAAQQHA